MSINWVMLSPETSPPFTPLPNETVLFSVPKRVGLSLTTPTRYPGRQQEPYSLTYPTGALYLTNRRVLYLPDKPSERLKSFASHILNLHDGHVTLNWFSPGDWKAKVQPVPGGGIPAPPGGVLELKFTFKEGGGNDFHDRYLEVRDKLQQAAEVSRMDGDSSRSSAAAINGMDVSNVNLEDLPRYQEESDGPLIAPTASAAAVEAQAQQSRSPVLEQEAQDSGVSVEGDEQPRAKPTDTPDEPPPGYEETQMAGVQDELERRLEREQR